MKKHLVRRDVEWKMAKDKEMLELLGSLPNEEKGLFMSPFFVEASGMGYTPEVTLRKYQDVIMKYYSLSQKLKKELGDIKNG